LGKGVNTHTDNLRVHTAGSDTRTTSVGTTTRSGWLEWCSHGCPKVTGTTSVDEEVNFNVDGDNDEEINCPFKDLDLHELENLKAGGH